MLQFWQVWHVFLAAAQFLHTWHSRVKAVVHALAVSLQLWSRPSQEVALIPDDFNFDVLFDYVVILVGFLFVLSLLVSFCAGALVAWSCARGPGHQPGGATTSEGKLHRLHQPPPRTGTPVPALRDARALQSSPGSARRRSRSDPPSPKQLGFANFELQVEQFPVPLCSPRPAPSAGGAFGQPLEEETSSCQGSRCRLRRVFYSP